MGQEQYQAIARDDAGGLDTKWLGKDGRELDIHLRSAPLYPGGLAAGAAFTALDISQRKRIEEALGQSENRYREVFETNQASKLIVDPEGGAIVDANQVACVFYGYSRQELPPRGSSTSTLCPQSRSGPKWPRSSRASILYSSSPTVWPQTRCERWRSSLVGC